MSESSDRGSAYALKHARVGDIVTLRCVPREAAVAGVSDQCVSVRWPWNEIDPDSMTQWNGLRSIPRTPDTPDWDSEPFQVLSPADVIRPQGVCEVAIPDVVAYVAAIDEFPEPLDVGWLPRPSVYLTLVSHGVRVPPHAEEVGFTLDPDGAEPIEAEMIHRPYAFLRDGDEVVDHAGRAWTFSAPWRWTSFDQGPGNAPEWPLNLISRDREADSQGDERVARATSSGTHADEITRWLTHAGLDEAPQIPLPED
ncbi:MULTISPECIES: hypothetical protein [unclassified Streptomyces]|uniref:hypothetical protein n=1 Tax=unclassified Streptomyces TaxID=2593676 RepID=UPI000DAB7D3F|nr:MULTISPECIES: hypothetical protein [unclassified Streptomyces]PZT77535.1 hypothetical protein DNK56_30645 [Streptomyces sp. AC1-42W]PZT78510.1 hypothetical protein DNK55_02035 [Streptomyces sp. AC1-42T]